MQESIDEIRFLQKDLDMKIENLKATMSTIIVKISPLLGEINDLLQVIQKVIKNQKNFEKYSKYEIVEVHFESDRYGDIVQSLRTKFRNQIRVQEAPLRLKYNEIYPKLDSVDAMTREMIQNYEKFQDSKILIK